MLFEYPLAAPTLPHSIHDLFTWFYLIFHFMTDYVPMLAKTPKRRQNVLNYCEDFIYHLAVINGLLDVFFYYQIINQCNICLLFAESLRWIWKCNKKRYIIWTPCHTLTLHLILIVCVELKGSLIFNLSQDSLTHRHFCKPVECN